MNTDHTMPAKDAVGPRPSARLPRRIGLVDLDASSQPSTAGLLLEDLTEALLAYDRVSNLPGAETDPPQITRIGAGASSIAGVDAFIIGGRLDGDHARRLERLLPHGGESLAGTRVYAVAVTEAASAAPLEPSLDDLAAWCQEHGLIWSGGVIVQGEAFTRAVQGTARMGWLRRRCSEAIDRLIGAIRGGMSVPEAAVAYGGPRRKGRRASGMRPDAIHVAPPLPRFLLRPLSRLLLQRGEHRHQGL
ncbi:MAG: hypothetical protein E7001_04900 [Coriobacteriaceae bacterium]|nr:hypothetical protein [Coriobacteriaceae bacterium]